MRVSRIVLASCAAAMAACSRGAAHPPSVAGFVIEPAAVPQDRMASGSLLFGDPGGDLSAAEEVLTDLDTGATATARGPIEGASGIRSGTLTFALDVSGFDPGRYALQVTLVDGGGSRSAPATAEFVVYGGFRGASGYGLPHPYVYVGDTAVADLDGDGRNDVVAMEFTNAARHVYVYHQTQGGALAVPPDEIDTGLTLSGIAAGDLNGDGLADLVVSGMSSTSGASVVLAFFQDPETHVLGSPQAVAAVSGGVSVADVDGDGRKDLVVAGGSIQVLFQGSSGALSAPVDVASSGLWGGEVHVGDLDGNGLADVVVRSGATQMAVYRQTSPRTFATSPDTYDVLTSYWPEAGAFAVGDVNGDGRADLVVTDPGNNGYLNFFLQTDHGTLAGPIASSPGFDMPAGVEIADVDGDGLADLVFDAGGGYVTVAHQRADHSFQDVYTYPIPTLSAGGTMVRQALSVADVTGDGRPDLVVSWMDEGVFVVPHL